MDENNKDDYKNAEDANFIELETNNLTPKKVLRRSATNKILFGVCGGLGEYYSVHPLIFRLIFVLALFYSNYAIVFYAVSAFLLKPPEISEIKHQKFSVFLGYSTLLFGAVLYIANKSAMFRYFVGTIDTTIYITFLFAFVGLYILLESAKFYSKDATIYRSRLYKLSNNKLIGGVCCGLAKYLNVSVISVRLIFLIITFLSLGTFTLIYLILFLTLPNYNEN